MTDEQQYLRVLEDEINRDLSTQTEDYQKGHRSAMIHAKNLFEIWFPQPAAIEVPFKENQFKTT